MSSTFIGAANNIKENDDINDYSREYVETVETCDKEEENRK